MEDKKITAQSAHPTVEFNFSESKEEKIVTGLVFEEADSLKIEEGENILKNAESIPEEQPTAEASQERADEFSIPDEFVVNQIYNTPTVEEEQAKIWTTYLPRFTGASDNYRMKNDPRPQQTAGVTEVKVNADTAKPKSTVDPTAEIDENVKDDSKVVVKVVGGDVEPEGESLNIFKFKVADVAPSEAPKAQEPTLVREEPAVAADPSVEEAVAVPAPEVDHTAEAQPEPKEYKIPDPVDTKVQVVDYSEKSNTQLAAYSFVPDGANEQPTASEKREFTTHGRRDNFKDKFLDLIMSSKIRIAVVAALSLALLAFENIGLFGMDIVKMFHLDFIPGAKALLDTQLCVCIYLLCLPEVIDSFKYIARKKVIPSLMLTTQLAVLIVYAAIIIATKAINYPLFGFLYAIFAITLLVSSYLKRSSDFSAFKHISKNEEKYILDKKETATLELENHALDGAVDEYKSQTVRVFKTVFVSDFFKRTGAVSVNMLKNVLALFATLAISLVVGLVCYFIPTSGMSGVTSALSAGVMTYLLACPAASLLSCFVAYYHCQRAAGDENSAILGDESFLGYSDVDVMTFEDTEVFTEEDVNLKRLMLYGDRENMTKAMRQMASLFAAVGGPLNRVFSNSLDRKVQPAESVTVEECGVSGIVDGVGICAGNEEYMSRHGIVVPASAEKSGGADTTKIMYAAENGQIYAKFDIRYSFSEEFTMIIPALKEKGIVPLIYTRDPNVNNELLAAITRDANTARVMKKLVDDPSENTVYRRASSGIVTTGDKLNALNMLLLAKKYADFKKRTTAMDYSAMAVGAVLAAIISFMGLSAVTAVIGVWHIAWCTVVGILSCKNFLKSKKKKETDNV